MPALIVVRSRRGDAAERARTAARPVLRRPWETLELWHAADGETAVAFAGEHGGLSVSEATGCVAAIDGEVFVGGILTSGAPAAAAVLRAYERGDELGAAEGAYAAVVWDPRTGSVVAATDRYSSRPLYIASEGETTLVAGELKAIPPVFPRRSRLDLDAVAAFLAYEHLFPRQALLDEIDVLPPATTATITAAGVTHKRRWRYELRPEPLGAEREWVEEFGRRLDSAVARRLDSETAVTISGGLDSRCVALSMLRQGLQGSAVSYGASGSGDLSIGADVARIAGFAHRSLPLEPGYIGRWADEAAWLYEGRFRALACHHLSLCALRDDGARSILIGFSGDDVLRDDPRGGPTAVDAPFIRSTHARRATCIDDALLEKLVKPAFADALAGAPKPRSVESCRTTSARRRRASRSCAPATRRRPRSSPITFLHETRSPTTSSWTSLARFPSSCVGTAVCSGSSSRHTPSWRGSRRRITAHPRARGHCASRSLHGLPRCVTGCTRRPLPSAASEATPPTSVARAARCSPPRRPPGPSTGDSSTDGGAQPRRSHTCREGLRHARHRRPPHAGALSTPVRRRRRRRRAPAEANRVRPS